MDVGIIQLIVNAAIVLVLFIAIFIMAASGTKYDYYYGVPHIQDPLKMRMARIVLLIVVISLGAAIFNIVFPLFFG